MNLIHGRLTTVFCIVNIIGTVLLTAPISAQVETRKIQDFYGVFLGKLVSDSSGRKRKRDLKLEIKPHNKHGFSVRWTTIIHREDGTDKIKNLFAKFAKLRRPGVYASEMDKDVFGNHTPLDPLDGEPYFWAGLKDDTLTVHTLFINASGGYEIHIYKRQLVGKTINVVFQRIIDGIPQKTLTATLQRTKNCDWKWICAKDNKCGWRAKNCSQ